MRLKLHEVRSDADFAPLFVAFRAAFAEPYNGLWPLFMGDWKPSDPRARQAALEECTQRFIAWHRADPTSTWLQVVDEDDGGRVVAGGRWSIYERADSGGGGGGGGGDGGSKNPYEDATPIVATWFPEGEARDTASALMNQFLGTAVRNMNRPHVFLNILFTVPEYRRRGAASLIMDWGMSRAQQRGLDVYIEATEEGRPLYERYGLKLVEANGFDSSGLPPVKDADIRNELAAQIVSFVWWSMMRKHANE